MATKTRIRLQPDHRFAFLQGFLKSPKQVGSIIPSSRFLERRIVRAAEIANASLVVELGPGTGGTTRALLRALSPKARLLAIEIDPRFVELLRRRPDPRLIVHEGSAAAVENLQTGLVTVFGFQAVINMAVNVSLLPAKGMTLPFISYGGSSLIGMALAMGLMLAFARRRPGIAVPAGGWQTVAA